MGLGFETLWRSAQERSWLQRPAKADVEAVAQGLPVTDSVVGVWRFVWSLTASSAVAVTSSALLIGDGQAAGPRRQFTAVLRSAPTEFRRGQRVLVIPRERISKVELTPHEIAVYTDIGAVHLPVPAGSSRYPEMEDALSSLNTWETRAAVPVDRGLAPPLRLDPQANDRMAAPRRTEQPLGLWEDHHLMEGRIRIRSKADATPSSGWVASAGRAWRRLPRWAQWGLSILIFVGLQNVAAPAGAVFLVLLVVFLLVTSRASVARRGSRARSPEAELAASESIEARVASAACRAWEETVEEPSWSSPAMAATRASFDGDGEVDAIVDLALRVHVARKDLGPPPGGPAREYWQQQWDALNRSALQLGERADALIRHRGQAAALSAELGQLAELERLERSALVVDDLTLATAARSLDSGVGSVSEQITGARLAVGEHRANDANARSSRPANPALDPLMPRKSGSPPTAGKDALRGLTLLAMVVVVLALLMHSCDDGSGVRPPASATATQSATTAPAMPADTSTTSARLRVPDVTGLRLDQAKQQLHSYGKGHGISAEYADSHDLSPRHRSQWVDTNWTVVMSRPAPGTPWTEGTDVHLFVLRNAEWTWFQAHPTMPQVPANTEPSALTADGQLFDGLSELMEYRYAPGDAPDYAVLPSTTPDKPIDGVPDDPSVEPTSERQPRDALAQGSAYGTLTVDTLPGPGTTLRVGQLLTLTVRDKPVEPAPSDDGGGVDVGGSYSDHDDDVNIPGWLCPTRFC